MLLVCDAGRHAPLLDALASLESPLIDIQQVGTFAAAEAALDQRRYDLCLVGSGPDAMPEHHFIERLSEIGLRLPVVLYTERGHAWEFAVMRSRGAAIVLTGSGTNLRAIARMVELALERIDYGDFHARPPVPASAVLRLLRNSGAHVAQAEETRMDIVSHASIRNGSRSWAANGNGVANGNGNGHGRANGHGVADGGLAAALYEADEAYAMLAEATSDAIISIDDEGTIIFANVAAEEMFCFSGGEMIGSPITMLVPESLHAETIAAIGHETEQLSEARGWTGLRVTGRRRDGTQIPVDLSFRGHRRNGRRVYTGVMREPASARDEEAKRLASVLQNVPVGIWESEIVPGTSSHRITYMNKRHEEVLGYSREEWSTMPDMWMAVIHPDDLERVIRELGENPDDACVSQHLRVVAKDGRTVWLQTELVGRRNEDGELLGKTGYALDVTDRVLAEERYRNIVETAQEAICTIDTEGHSTFANSRAVEMLGYSIDELAEMTILDLVRPEYVPELQSLLEQSNAGNGLRFDMEFLTRDGQPIWCMVATSPIRDANGVLIGGLGMLTDITERKHAEAELRRAHDELEARVAERTAELGDIMHRLEEAYVKQKRFIADASHDIRTPLTTVRAELDLMRASTRIDSTVGATLDRIAPQIIRLARLTDNLLLLATMDSEGTADRRVETHMEELVLEAIVDLSGVAREGGVSWNVSYDGVLDVACDASALKMAITNILQNALKHSPAGAVIDVELKGVDGAVAIVIRDSGAGISPEHLPFIFDRFYRGDQARSSQGTGLGLSIVKSVVEAHGGTVSVDSTLNVGTTITIVLPR